MNYYTVAIKILMTLEMISVQDPVTLFVTLSDWMRHFWDPSLITI